MNVLPYEMKRAHWRGTWHAIQRFRERSVEIGEPKLWHMTPARFDVLCVACRADWLVHENRRELGLPQNERRIAMWELRELLGLARPTVSRTAHGLERLDFVRVVRDEKDVRIAIVVLTELGERTLRLAVECIRQDEVGMRDCIVKHVSDGAFERLRDVEPAQLVSLDDRLGTLVDQSRSYARFFGCQAIPIYDTRVVLHLRPRTVSLLTWAVRGPDPRSEIMRMNMLLIEAARSGDATCGLGSRTALEEPEPERRSVLDPQPPAQRPRAAEAQAPAQDLPPIELWRLADLPAEYFP